MPSMSRVLSRGFMLPRLRSLAWMRWEQIGDDGWWESRGQGRFLFRGMKVSWRNSSVAVFEKHEYTGV